MKSSEQLVTFCEAQLAERLSHFIGSEITRLTPSCREGVRYMGFKQDGKEFFIEIEVKEV